jgi:hypothetical protein
MLANTAIQARPGIFAGRPAALESVPVVPVAEPGVVTPRAPWRRGHLSFRGTRIFTSLMLGWAGLIVLGFAAFAVPAASALGRDEVDPGLMHLLGSIAPWLVAFGIVHVVAAVGIGRDREWGFRLGIWTLAGGTLVVLAGLVFAVAGRDAFSLTDPASSGAANGIALFAWTLALYALVGWGVRRILAARALLPA